MQYTTKEIINRAKDLAQVTNSKAFSFPLLMSLVNNVYTSLYNEISGLGNSFIDRFEFTGKEADLPSDCNKVLSVMIDKEYISQGSFNRPIPFTYTVEDRTIRIHGKNDSRKVTVKYSRLPLVLTAPDEPVPLDAVDVIGLLANNYISTWCEYDPYNDQISFGKVSQYSAPFMRGQLKLTTSGRLTWTSELDGTESVDVTDHFIQHDQYGHEMEVSGLKVSDPYVAVTYENGDIYIYTGFEQAALYNPLLYKGKRFQGDVLAFRSDDSTGYGMVVQQTDREKGTSGYFYASYMTDTVIDYPDNVFFDVIIDRLAVQLQSLQGLNNDALQKKLEYDEQSFFGCLQRSQQGMRIRNDDNTFNRRVW